MTTLNHYSFFFYSKYIHSNVTKNGWCYANAHFLWEIAWLSLHIPSSPNAIKWYFLQKAIYSSYAPYNTLFIIQEN